jgi:hypothetical protein
VDISAGDVALARQRAAERGCATEIIEGECINLSRQKSASADLILFTEVSFFMPDYPAALREDQPGAARAAFFPQPPV